jgi:hypothetical protein
MKTQNQTELAQGVAARRNCTMPEASQFNIQRTYLPELGRADDDDTGIIVDGPVLKEAL